MSSESATIEIRTQQNLFPVELLDHQFRRLHRGYGNLRVSVPPGIYMARCEIGGPAVERLVRVQPGQSLRIDFDDPATLLLPSSAPVPGSVSRHEFYTEAASSLATRTPPHATFGSGARLVLFATHLDFAQAPDFSQPAPCVHWGDVTLRDIEGRVLAELPGDSLRDDFDRASGRAGLCLDLNPGGYFLEWPTSSPADPHTSVQPLWLPEGWITCLFAGAVGANPTPRQETVSVHMCRLGNEPPPYEPEADQVNAAAELALASLRTGRRQLGNDQVQMLLHAKFSNPMLGLLGAHMLLQRSKPNQDLLGVVCWNLHALLGEHPDVVALGLLMEARFGTRLGLPDVLAIEFPPMLRDGLLAVDRALWQKPESVGMSRAARLARLRILPQGPWTLFWKPTDAVPDATPSVPPAQSFPEFETGPLAGAELETNESTEPRSAFSAPGFLRSPIVDAESQATAEAEALLVQYLLERFRRGGPGALASLDANILGWTGLDPRTAASIVDRVLMDLGDGAQSEPDEGA